MSASRIRPIYGLLFLMSLSPGVQAALVQHPFTGAVTFVDSGFTGGIGMSSVVNGSVTYDTSLVSPSGLDTISLGLNDPESNPAFGLVFNIGPYTFSETDEGDYAWGYPRALFNNGQITGLDFIVETPDWFFDALGSDQFEIYSLDGNTLYVQGAITFGNPMAVPVPAAVWLFGSGLLGLVGIARRKARAA